MLTFDKTGICVTKKEDIIKPGMQIQIVEDEKLPLKVEDVMKYAVDVRTLVENYDLSGCCNHLSRK